MNRYLIMSILMLALSMSGIFNVALLYANNSATEKQIITRDQASEFASKLANEKFQKDFGISPFTPESYPAELIGNRWYWGKIDPV